MDSKNIFCFVCIELQNPPEIHASELEYPLNVTISFKLINIQSKYVNTFLWWMQRYINWYLFLNIQNAIHFRSGQLH